MESSYLLGQVIMLFSLEYWYKFTFLCNFYLFFFLQILDEEAEVFVVKMWRLLVYETEAKKLGLVK